MAPSRLDEILARGTLRACTTGDYKPYSFYKGDGQFEGIDARSRTPIPTFASRPAGCPRIEARLCRCLAIVRDTSPQVRRECAIALAG